MVRDLSEGGTLERTPMDDPRASHTSLRDGSPWATHGTPLGNPPWNTSSPPQTTDFQEEMRRKLMFDKDSSTWFTTMHRCHNYFPLLSDTPAPSYSIFTQLHWHCSNNPLQHEDQLIWKPPTMKKLVCLKFKMTWGISRSSACELTACPALSFLLNAMLFSILTHSTWNPGGCTKSQSFHSHGQHCKAIKTGGII